MKTRIGILGMGGVGGYYGGLLAKAYAGSDEVEVIFIARGKTQEIIAESGLKIITDESETTVFPNVVSDNPEIIGKLDFLICATKTYDIEESLIPLKKCITKDTVFLPLCNGVDAPERISTIFPDNEVLQGCVYIFSLIVSPGIIKKNGAIEKLPFGSKSASAYKMKALQTIFQNAKIESYLVDDIEEGVWEKFILVSALASASCYLKRNNSEILENASGRNLIISLLNESTKVAAAKGLNLPSDIVEQTLIKLDKTPRDTTSSMYRDLLAGKKTELSSLTEFVVKEGLKYKVDTPNYKMILEKLAGEEKN